MATGTPWYNAPIEQGFGVSSLQSEPAGYVYPGGEVGFISGQGGTAFQHIHTGVDFGVPMGTPITAIASGTVASAGWDTSGYGNTVIENVGGKIGELFGHLSSIAVHPGEAIQAGQLLGYSGSTGNSTGPHLHFSVIDETTGNYENPTPFYQSIGTTQTNPITATQPSDGTVSLGSASGGIPGTGYTPTNNNASTSNSNQICPINVGPFKVCFPNPVMWIEHAAIVGVLSLVVLVLAILFILSIASGERKKVVG